MEVPFYHKTEGLITVFQFEEIKFLKRALKSYSETKDLGAAEKEMCERIIKRCESDIADSLRKMNFWKRQWEILRNGFKTNTTR